MPLGKGASVLIVDTPKEVASYTAQAIGKLIFNHEQKGKKTVLCLPTGSTPIPTYKELVRMHKEEELSFKNVTSFNLDEYIGLPKNHPESYNYFMKHHLFDHVDIDPKNAHVPDGTLPLDQYEQYAAEYERQIKEAGGYDLALVGIGRTGHIAFNEPPSTLDTRTRVAHIHDTTIQDAAPAFGGYENVPKTAITQGLGTVYEARHIILIATGKNKAEIMAKALEDESAAENPQDCPAVYFRNHPHITIILDKDAASLLKNEYEKK